MHSVWMCRPVPHVCMCAHLETGSHLVRRDVKAESRSNSCPLGQPRQMVIVIFWQGLWSHHEAKATQITRWTLKDSRSWAEMKLAAFRFPQLQLRPGNKVAPTFSSLMADSVKWHGRFPVHTFFTVSLMFAHTLTHTWLNISLSTLH